MRYTSETDDAIGGSVAILMVIAATVKWGWAGLFLGLVVLLLVRSINGIR